MAGKMNDLDFVAIVQQEFGELATKHRMDCLGARESRAMKSVMYANAERLIVFSLEVQDVYAELSFGPRSALIAKDDGYDYDWFALRGLGKVLFEEDGVQLPVGVNELYFNQRLRERVRSLCEGVLSHESLVFSWQGSVRKLF